MQEPSEGDHADPTVSPAATDRDLHLAVGDVADLGDLAHDRTRRVHGLASLVIAPARDDLAGRECEVEPLGGGEVGDPLVGALPVVVVAEPVEELLQVGEILGRSLLASQAFRVLWKRSSLPRVCGW